MTTLDSQTLMFANATVAGAVAAMAFVYARGQASARPVARGWGWLMTAFAALRIPLMADSDSIAIADSVPDDDGHAARVS